MQNNKGVCCWSSKGEDKFSFSFISLPVYLLVAIGDIGQIKEQVNNSQHDKTEMETMSEFSKGETLNFLHINWVNSFTVKRYLKLLLKKVSSVGQQRLTFIQARNCFSIVL